MPSAHEAVREHEADLAEGADALMVKPALAYLDIIHATRARFPDVPLAAYNVSGDYAMVRAAAAQGWLDERRTVREILTAIRRPGADFIITCHAKDAARWPASRETMAETTPITLNHYALVAFSPEYWSQPAAERQRIHREWLSDVGNAADATAWYQTYGLEAQNDLLVWSARRRVAADTAGIFFGDLAAGMAPFRRWVTVRETLWGFTRPSQYTKVRSTQELDPFTSPRAPYLVVYPFVKNAEWYLAAREERQQLMGGHIRVGKQFEDITQLLLYSFGLQDQEFVVVYEMADLLRFLELVQTLRETEARRFTVRDWPLHAGVLQPDFDALARWL